METDATYTAFAGARRVAAGPLDVVLPVLKRRFDADRSELVLVFEDGTGRPVDFDLRGPVDEVLAREARRFRRGPGRPRLGVTSREVTLLPRHWEWLEQQQSGISGALRRLVEAAAKLDPGKERAARLRDALGRFLSAMAGDRPGYEEATRALYRGEAARFEAARLAAAAAPAPSGEAVVAELHRAVWSEGDYGAVARLVAPRYVVHSDPGDPWEGQTLDRARYAERVAHSRAAFPDLAFTTHDLVAAGDRVAARWSAEGTHAGDLPGLPATGRRVGFAGQTIYELRDGRVAGHWQVVDRLGFVRQLARGA